MKRKVVQIAGFTKVISLPCTWVKNHGINKGDELEIREEGKNLLISPERGEHFNLAKIDLTKTDRFLRRFIDIYYRLGYDELEIALSDDYVISLIQQEVSDRLLGFEIVEQKKGFCKIKGISNGVEEEFDIILRRIFMMLISMSKDGLDAIKQKKYDRLESAIKLEEINNKFTNFCQRHLNKNGYPDNKRTTIIYHVVTVLEMIADSFAEIFKTILTSKRRDLDTRIVDIFKIVDSMIQIFYNLFYSFRRETLIEFDDKWKEVISRDEEWFKSAKNAGDTYIIHQLHSTAKMLHHLSEMTY